MPKEVFVALQKVWVSGQQIKIARLGEKRAYAKDKPRGDKRPAKKKGFKSKPAKAKAGKPKSANDKPRKKTRD
jgi:hypothetical protein